MANRTEKINGFWKIVRNFYFLHVPLNIFVYVHLWKGKNIYIFLKYFFFTCRFRKKNDLTKIAISRFSDFEKKLSPKKKFFFWIFRSEIFKSIPSWRNLNFLVFQGFYKFKNLSSDFSDGKEKKKYIYIYIKKTDFI